MKRYLLLILSSLLFIEIAVAQKRVVDAIDNSPVASAPIFNTTGNVVGMTSFDGDFSDIPESAYPITIRCIGYESLIIEESKDTTILMLPSVYELEEVVVSAKRDVLKQTFYVREYFTLSNATDTVSYFLEHMADRYVATSEDIKFSKNSLRNRNCRSYVHFKVENVDSVAYESEPSFPSFLSIVQFINKEFDTQKFFKDQTGATKLYEDKGKSGTTMLLKQNENTLTMVADFLADSKDHDYSNLLLKMIGLSMNIEQLYSTFIYEANDSGHYLPKDLIQTGIVMEAEGKGKLFRLMLNSKTPVAINSSIELYVVDREYLSKEQAKKEYKDKKSKIPFEIPASVPDLDEATKQLVKRANALKNDKPL